MKHRSRHERLIATEEDSDPVPEAARAIFAERVDLAARFAALLRNEGVVRGLIGPHERERLWDRHLLNSAALAELLAPECRAVDVGSGAGLPGIPLAIARPDIRLTLLEPMVRRVTWLRDVIAELGLDVEVVRGRAEEVSVRERLASQDVALSRAVAPLGRLAGWCLPLLRQGGQMLAIKGVSAADEIARDAAAVRSAGGDQPVLAKCGDQVLDVPTTVVVVRRTRRSGTAAGPARRRDGEPRKGKDRAR